MINSDDDGPGSPIVDLSFALRGGAIEVDYADRLRTLLCAALPWLDDETSVGVHPLYGLFDGGGKSYLSGRSRLVLRLPRHRVDAALSLCGQRLDLGTEVEVRSATQRELMAATVLYSPFVTHGPAEEAVFFAACEQEIGDLDFGRVRLICGKAHRAKAAQGDIFGFSLMVYGLGVANSLRLQEHGLGDERQRGCGIFVPHKAVAAVVE